MAPPCKTVAFLQDLAARRDAADPSLAHVASNALAIFSDMQEYGITDTALHAFHDLTDSLLHDQNIALSAYLDDDGPDCAICAALKRLRSNP